VTALVPLLLHMIMVVPPDWRFVFFGSKATVRQVRNSPTASAYEHLGKLWINNLEDRWAKDWHGESIANTNVTELDELTSRLLTNNAFYEEELPNTDWLFTFHSDSILCTNAEQSLDDWLQWDWVGAPW
jgi:hypothetical protein